MIPAYPRGFYIDLSANCLYSSLEIPGFGEGFEAAIVGFFHVIGETAGGQLSALEMITQTIAADAFAGTAGIGAVAVFQIRILFTFHGNMPFYENWMSSYLASKSWVHTLFLFLHAQSFLSRILPA